MNTTVSLAAGRIVVRPCLLDLLTCSRLGGRWENGIRGWTFPATQGQARALRERLRHVVVADAAIFESLIFGAQRSTNGEPGNSSEATEAATSVVAAVAAPEPPAETEITVPDGMLTHPWRHQRAAFQFCLDKFAAGMHGILLAMGMGCVEGDAELIINRRGCARRITLREFYRKFHGGESNGRRWQDYPTRMRSMIKGELHLNDVLNVMAQGVKPVVRIKLASGKSLRVTYEHQIACPDRWLEANKFAPGDVVLTNGIPVCKSCGGTHRITTYRYAKYVGICRSCIGKFRRIKGKVIDKDGYRLDGGKVQFVPKPDTVVSVEPDGETDVYDVSMAAPGHNFVANGIIVHNCGKSLVACMLVLHLTARRVLIACPLRVVPVWVTQFERHVGIPVVIVALDEDYASVAKKQQEAAEKMKLAQVLGRPFILVVNYDSAWRDPFAAWAERVPWDLVIADEAHRIKAPSGKASLFFKRLRLRAAHRIALTGTPMPHGPMDIYAVFRFLDVSIFGPSFTAFRTKYAVMGGFQRKQITGFQNLDELERRMSRVTFKVGDEVLDLPPATDVTYYCELTGEAARIYRDLEEDFVARVKDGTVTAANAMVKLLRLQQITGGCVPTDDETIHRIDSSKQRLLADTLEDIGKDEPVVVFCRFTADLLAVHEACEGMGFSSLELSGKRDELKRWQDGEAQVLAVQIDAGSEGVDFTRARYSLFYSVGYSLGKYDQARKRTHRPGQTKPVTHIHLIARNTVDVKVMRALEKRAEIVNSILAEIKN